MTNYAPPPTPPPPPSGYPPPPATGYGEPGLPGGRQTNGWAIASLVCGIVGCVPFLTGLLAVIFGIIGLRKTRDPRVGGKGLAIAGLVLGIVSILLWALFGGALLQMWRGTAGQRDVARQFFNDIAAGNVAAAQAKATSNVTPEQIQAAVDEVKAYGALKDVTLFGVEGHAQTGARTTTEVAGALTFDSKGVAVKATVVKEGDVYKVDDFKLDPQ